MAEILIGQYRCYTQAKKKKNDKKRKRVTCKHPYPCTKHTHTHKHLPHPTKTHLRTYVLTPTLKLFQNSLQNSLSPLTISCAYTHIHTNNSPIPPTHTYTPTFTPPPSNISKTLSHRCPYPAQPGATHRHLHRPGPCPLPPALRFLQKHRGRRRLP